ncbi:SDR family NAD(P)-dependent oxidoreductase [Mycobacterium sp. NPDC051198]
MTRSGAIDAADQSSEGALRTALVTGASSGIGMAIARLLAAKGFNVVVLARRRDKLEKLCAELSERWGVQALPLVADLAVADTPAQVAAELASRSVRIDFLVNNAGYAQLGRYELGSWDEHLKRVRVMGTSTLELTHRLLPGMVEHRWGRIINVASIAGLFTATPQDVLYAATKSMVIKFSEGIAAEYAGLGINCTVSQPGFTDTEIFSTSEFQNQVQSNPFMKMALMSPETVARQAYSAVMSGDRAIVHGWHHKMLAWVLLYLPESLRRALSIRLANVEHD